MGSVLAVATVTGFCCQVPPRDAGRFGIGGICWSLGMIGWTDGYFLVLPKCRQGTFRGVVGFGSDGTCSRGGGGGGRDGEKRFFFSAVPFFVVEGLVGGGGGWCNESVELCLFFCSWGRYTDVGFFGGGGFVGPCFVRSWYRGKSGSRAVILVLGFFLSCRERVSHPHVSFHLFA